MQDIDLYEQFADAVAAHQLGTSAASLHGSLCGYLCSGGTAQGTLWLDEVLQDPDLSAELSSEAKPLFSALLRVAHEQLDDTSMRFMPLLPADENALSERVTALNEWCSGYLGGLGLGGRFSSKRTLSREGREALNDLERIARSVIELDEDAEGDEQAWAELVEFVRVGVQLMHLELNEPSASERLSKPARDRTH